jgi:hypothetical protein
VAGTGDLIAGEHELESFPENSTLLNDAGVVAVGVQLRHRASGSSSQSAVLFPFSGAPRLLALSGSPGGINDRGAVAVYDGERDAILVVESEDEPKQLVRFGDAVGEGGIFAAGGLHPEGRCLSADGRVAATVVSHVASPALACGDADGFVALTGPNNPARDGSPFAAVGGCAFAETGVLFAGAHYDDGLWEWNLYRADATGLERLVGPDQVTADGARVIELNDDLGGEPSFQANAPGSVLVRADTDRGERLLRRRADGALESIFLNTNPELPIQRVIATRLMDDDTVFGTVQLATDENAIVTSDGTSVRLLAAASDPRLPDGPFDSLGLLSVGGDRIVIRASTNDDFVKTLLYSDTLGFLPFFADGIEREALQATVGGRALVEDVVDGQTRQFLLAPDGSLTLLATRGLGGRTVIAINDRDNVLFRAEATLLQTSRDALLLSGPVPSARCPRVPVTETETPEPTATPSRTETSRPTETATSVETATPTRTPTPSGTAPPTQTHAAASTQTPLPTSTVVGASPTAVESPVFSDGCQVASAGAPGWVMFLPIFALLAAQVLRGGFRPSKSQRRGVVRETHRSGGALVTTRNTP